MKRLLISLILASSAIASDIRVFMWQELRDQKTAERTFTFCVASEAVKAAFEAEARGEDAEAADLAAKVPPDAWMFALSLQGEAKSYSKEKISMVRGHDLIEIVSGRIAVDLKKQVIEIALEVRIEGKVAPFPGNGTFRVFERPKR